MSEARVPIEEVRRIAALARLTLDDAEAVRLAGDLAEILGYVSRLAELEPIDEPAATEPAATEPAGALRADEPRPGLAPAHLLAEAPATVRGHFVVPQVVGE
jgi:aspartyl-tRNA(Asn)/glutamyl-tRNA(Gln) amidotransferase subunit C